MEYLRTEVLVVRYGMVPSVAFTKNPFKNPIDFGSDVTGNAKTTGFVLYNIWAHVLVQYDEKQQESMSTKTSMCLFST